MELECDSDLYAGVIRSARGTEYGGFWNRTTRAGN